MSKIEEIVSPSHYLGGNYETIDIIESITKQCDNPFEGYLLGNIVKYISRYRLKGGVQDCKKANWYLNKLIKHLEV